MEELTLVNTFEGKVQFVFGTVRFLGVVGGIFSISSLAILLREDFGDFTSNASYVNNGSRRRYQRPFV